MLQHSCILHSHSSLIFICIASLRNSLGHLHSCILSLEPPIAWFTSKKSIPMAHLRALKLEIHSLALRRQGALSRHPSIPNSWNHLDRRVQSVTHFECTVMTCRIALLQYYLLVALNCISSKSLSPTSKEKNVLDLMDLSNDRNTSPHTQTFYATIMTCTRIKQKVKTIYQQRGNHHYIKFLLLTCLLLVQKSYISQFRRYNHKLP